MKLNLKNINYRHTILRYLGFFSGLFIVANGVVCTINANLGVYPWDVFHIGIANITGLSIGRVHQIAGFVILAISYFFKVPIRLGTFLNMIFLGFFIDLVIALDYIPHPNLLWAQIILYLTGAFLFGFGCAFYISPDLGAGPRDSLMLALVKITRRSIPLIRTVMETIVAIVGYFLGGPLGLGTVIFALSLGFFIDLGFKIVGQIKKTVLFKKLWHGNLHNVSTGS